MVVDHGEFDSVVVGAGLSGLTAGIRLLQMGHRVLIIERRSVPGGLCGTKVIDGYEFVIACNDFGSGFRTILQSLGCEVKFKPARTKLVFDDASYTLPLDVKSALQLARLAPDVMRFYLRMRAAGNDHVPLRQLLDTSKSQRFKDLVQLPCYLVGMVADEMTRQFLAEEFSDQYKYGYQKLLEPVGGPQKVTEAMVDCFLKLGGCLKLDTPFIGTENLAGKKKVMTQSGNFITRHLISSVHRDYSDAPHFKPGLSLSMFLVALRTDFRYPDGLHTIVYLPPDISGWMEKIDQGVQPDRFGFHFFRSDLPSNDYSYTINIYFPTARGLERPLKIQAEAIHDYVFEQIEKFLPGFNKAIIYKLFLSVADFHDLHGLSSMLAPCIRRRGFRKLGNYDPQDDIYYIGNSVDPPGEHAGGAVLSAIQVCEQIQNRSETRFPTGSHGV